MTKVGITRWSRWSAADGALSPDLLPAAMRRRASRLTRMAGHVVSRLVGDDAELLQRSALVLGTSLGELDTTLELLQLVPSRETSALRFTNSVHNAALGTLTIATQHRGFATTISAGPQTVAMAWLEATALLGAYEQVILVFAELELGEPFPTAAPYDAMAAAFCLERPGAPSKRAATLRRTRAAAHPKVPSLPVGLSSNPCAPAWTLCDGCESAPTIVSLGGSDGGEPWCLEIGLG